MTGAEAAVEITKTIVSAVFFMFILWLVFR